jgi:hypothetical protein
MIDLGRIAKQKRPRSMSATGGEITDVIIEGKRYKVHTFLSSGNLDVQDGGEFEYLVVAGGGAGGTTSGSIFGGGGGAGGLRLGKINIGSDSQVSVIVGGPGENSSFDSIVSARGGRGGNGVAGGAASLRTGQAGGSGGGAGGGDTIARGVPGAGNTPATIPSQGFGGGQSTGGAPYAGGGGGAGGAGEVTNQLRNGFPGPGLTTNFSGEIKTYATGGSSGLGYQESTPNTGDGGVGGQPPGLNGLPGASGIVIIRYRYRHSKD